MKNIFALLAALACLALSGCDMSGSTESCSLSESVPEGSFDSYISNQSSCSELSGTAVFDTTSTDALVPELGPGTTVLLRGRDSDGGFNMVLVLAEGDIPDAGVYEVKDLYTRPTPWPYENNTPRPVLSYPGFFGVGGYRSRLDYVYSTGGTVEVIRATDEELTLSLDVTLRDSSPSDSWRAEGPERRLQATVRAAYDDSAYIPF